MSDEARSTWDAFITAPENAALLKRYAKSAKEPAPLFESIGEDLGSTNEEVRASAFWALVAAMPELTNILHERETRSPGWRDERGKDQQMVNRGVDILSYLHRVLVKEHRFKIRDEYGKDPRPFLKTTVHNWETDEKSKRKRAREVQLDYETALEIPDPTGSVEARVILSKVLAEVLEEAKADNLDQAEETKEYISLAKEMLSTASNSYRRSLWDTEEVRARQAEREIKTEHGIIIVLDDYSATPTPLLNERGYVSKEWEPKQQDFETEKLQALKEVGDSTEKLKSPSDISDETESFAHAVYKACQKGASFEEIKEIIQQKKSRPIQQKKGDVFLHRPKPEEAVQPPDLSEIPLWRGSKRERMSALDFLKTNYGQYLSAFGAEQNSVFQDQIRARDPKLVQGVINQLREEGKGRKVHDFLKTRSARVDQELENVSVEDLKKNPRLASGLYKRAVKAKAPASRSATRK